MFRSAFVAIALCLSLPGLVAPQDALTNESIGKLVKAGVSEEIIVNMIRTQPTNFSIGVEQLLILKAGGVSDRVLDAMVSRRGGTNRIPGPAGTPGQQTRTPSPEGYPAAGGVFYRSSSGWIRIEDANPQSKNKGMVGMMINPLGKMSMKWSLEGKEAPLKIANSQPEFCIVDYDTPRAVKVVELDQHKDSRDVEYAAVGLRVGGMRTGMKKDKLQTVVAERIADRVVLVKFEQALDNGEYAIDLDGTPRYDFSIRAGSQN